MDIAYCTIDNNTYDISSFSQLDAHILDKYRRALVCTECNGQGYYCKEAINGKPACFCAYHEDSCIYKSKDTIPRYDPGTIEEVNTIITNSETIDINFSAYTASQLKPMDSRKPSSSRALSKSSKQHTRQPVQYRNMNKGLRSLLRMLMHTDSFRRSDIKINTGFEYPYKAKNLFVNFDEITEKHLKKNRGYWGIISHADNDIEWLNTANEQNVSILISEVKGYISEAFNIESDSDLEGVAVLVFGWLNTSKNKNNKKWYIKPSQPGHIFIKLNE